MDTNRKYFYFMDHVYGIGPQMIKRLLAVFDSPREAYEADESSLARIVGEERARNWIRLKETFDLEKEFERRQCEAVLHTCLEQMKEPDKSVFLYRYFYGYKRKDIADKLSLSIKQVENILYRGKEKLRKDLLERRAFYE